MSAEESIPDVAALTAQAAAGEPGAQFRLGGLLFTGSLVPEDRAAAIEWWEKAAGGGSHDAQFMLGQCFAFGTGQPQDAEQAFTWYQRAAQGGHLQARLNIASMLLSGSGVPKDEARAFAWLLPAAEEGSGKAAVDWQSSAPMGRPWRDCTKTESAQARIPPRPCGGIWRRRKRDRARRNMPLP
jgi:uncharacterized protein